MKRNNLTLSFCTNPSLGVGDMMINVMDNFEQNIADFISTVPKGCIFDAHSVISYLLKNHSDDYFDFHNDAEPTNSFHSRVSRAINPFVDKNIIEEPTNSFHSRVSRAINPFVDKNIIERIDAKSYSLNIRGNFSENSCWKKLSSNKS